MQEIRTHSIRIRQKQTVPLNFLEDESTLHAAPADSDWDRIEIHLREFWERCRENVGEFGLARLDDLSALAGLEPIVDDLLWLRPVEAKRFIRDTRSIPDFIYDYVGANVCDSNGRDFEGDRILGKAGRNVSDNGGAGLQSELYTRMTLSICTGHAMAYRGAMVNARKTICELRVRLLPVGLRDDVVTDLIGAATIKRAKKN